jgi:hypothetical protein
MARSDVTPPEGDALKNEIKGDLTDLKNDTKKFRRRNL